MSQSEKIIIEPDYDIVSLNSNNLKDQILQHLKDGAQQILIDLNQVNLVDSTGLSVMIAVHNSLKKLGNSLELANVSDDILKLLKITRLDKHFVITEQVY